MVIVAAVDGMDARRGGLQNWGDEAGVEAVERAFGGGLVVQALDLLVGVPAREGEEEGEVCGGESGEEPVEEVQAAAVQVVDDPAAAARDASDAHDGGQQHGAQEVADADGAQEDGRAQAAHGVGRLVVEELQRADRREHLRRAQEHVLRQQNEHAHRHRLVRQVQQSVLLRNLHPPPLLKSHSDGNLEPGEGNEIG